MADAVWNQVRVATPFVFLADVMNAPRKSIVKQHDSFRLQHLKSDCKISQNSVGSVVTIDEHEIRPHASVHKFSECRLTIPHDRFDIREEVHAGNCMRVNVNRQHLAGMSGKNSGHPAFGNPNLDCNAWRKDADQNSYKVFVPQIWGAAFRPKAHAEKPSV